jgi:hypothetical protein
VGSVTYKLKLSAHSAIHLVVHVSQLRLAEGFKGQVSSQLPSDMVKYQVPLQILNTRLVTRGDNQVSQVLIKGLNSQMIWQHGRTMRRWSKAFQLHLLGDKQLLKGGRMSVLVVH